MNKKIGTWIFGILVVLYLIGVMFGGNESSTSENSENEKSEDVLVEKYSNLPIKQDLSYFVSPQNIAGQIILRTDKSPLSNYEKGLELNGDRNIRQEKLNNAFNISRYRVYAVVTAEINSKKITEFEIDDFEKKLKEEFAKSIQPIRDTYKNVDKHIRIVNLNIPVKYSKESKAVALIKITNIASLQKLNYSKPILMSDFIKEELDNTYISQYIIPSKEKSNFEAIVKYDGNRYDGGLKIKGDAKLLNEIGKVNKGNDTITELTLHVWDSSIATSKSHTTKFVITSFKLKSSNKRFTTNQYINLIDTIQSFGNTYFIESDGVDMSMKED